MSREATGENGAVLGNSEYWNREPIHLFRWTDAAVVGDKRSFAGNRWSSGECSGGNLRCSKTSKSSSDPSARAGKISLHSRCGGCMMCAGWLAPSALTAATVFRC